MTAFDKKTIAIVGGTGNQGSSVTNTFLALPGWHVRVLTRSTTSDKAKALAAAGAEVIAIDLNDPATLDPAFKGAHVIFVNTDFGALFGGAMAAGLDSAAALQQAHNTEKQQGINAADAAAKVSTLERYVYSALASPSKASNGKYDKSFHWESKASVVDYILEKHAGPDGLASKASFIYVGGYSDSPLLRPQRDPASGTYIALLPGAESTVLPIINPRKSVGPFVRALIEDEKPGSKLLAYDTARPVQEYFQTWSRLTGKDYLPHQVSLVELQKATGYPLELIEPYAFVFEFPYASGLGDVMMPEDLKVKYVSQTYEDYLKEQDDKFLLGEGN